MRAIDKIHAEWEKAINKTSADYALAVGRPSNLTKEFIDETVATNKAAFYRGALAMALALSQCQSGQEAQEAIEGVHDELTRLQVEDG